MLKLVIAGRPNTGKSTLYNALTKTRDALTHDLPGVTRDVLTGIGRIGDFEFELFDTAGLEKASKGIAAHSTRLALLALEAADAILFVVDGRAGLTAQDEDWARIIRKLKKPVILLMNKAESKRGTEHAADFYRLGFGEPIPISAEHKQGLFEITDKLGVRSEELGVNRACDNTRALKQEQSTPHSSLLTPNSVRITIIGQPNVGKSTLVNKILGRERVIVMDQPGVTRDVVSIKAHFMGRDIVLNDTAGLRRKANVVDDVETLSALKSLDALNKTDAAILMVDATKDIENQALGIAARVYDAGKILAVALNKWDLVAPELREDLLLKLKRSFKNSFHQIIKPLILPISADKGTGVRNLFKRVFELYDIAGSRAPTSLVNRTIEKLIAARQPPLSRLKRPMKVKFAAQTGNFPTVVTIYVGGATDMPESYTRYLRRGLSEALGWEQLPVVIEYKKSENPFEN
jgi:GTP-binding protein